MNRHIDTVIVAPMTTKGRDYPTRIPVRFRRKTGQIVLDQIRTVNKMRLVKRMGKIVKKAKASSRTHIPACTGNTSPLSRKLSTHLARLGSGLIFAIQ